jgi:hypothetical protein
MGTLLIVLAVAGLWTAVKVASALVQPVSEAEVEALRDHWAQTRDEHGGEYRW